MLYRATGYKPDFSDITRPQIAERFGAAGLDDAALPAEFSNEHLLYECPEGKASLPEALLQFGTQTCVAFQCAEAVWCEQRRLGIPAEACALISPAAVYYAGLRKELGPNATLVDDGSRPRLVWQAMREVGVPYWEDWPLERDKQQVVTQEPPAGTWIAASDPDFVRDLRYDTVSLKDRPAALKRAMVAGHCVGMGLTLSASFADVYREPWQGRGDEPVTGRHMVNAFAYDGNGVWIHHWWEGWGLMKCRGQIAWSVLCSPETTDLITAVLDLSKW